MPAAAIDHQRVARLHVPQNAAHAGNGRNAAAAGDDRGVAGLAAGLRDDAADIEIAQGDGLRGQQLVGDDDHRPLQDVAVGNLLSRKVRRDADDHVAQVVQPLFEIFVVGAGKQDRVFVEQAGQAGLGREPVVDDPAADLVGEGAVAKDRLVDAEDARLRRAQLVAPPYVAAREARAAALSRAVS